MRSWELVANELDVSRVAGAAKAAAPDPSQGLLSDIYILVHNSSKITVAALGELRTTELKA